VYLGVMLSNKKFNVIWSALRSSPDPEQNVGRFTKPFLVYKLKRKRLIVHCIRDQERHKFDILVKDMRRVRHFTDAKLRMIYLFVDVDAASRFYSENP
jgi:hypothetical protein